MEPTWLVDFGVWVDDLIGDRRIAVRFREMLLEKGRRDVQILKNPNKGKNPSTQDEESPFKNVGRRNLQTQRVLR